MFIIYWKRNGGGHLNESQLGGYWERKSFDADNAQGYFLNGVYQIPEVITQYIFHPVFTSNHRHQGYSSFWKKPYYFGGSGDINLTLGSGINFEYGYIISSDGKILKEYITWGITYGLEASYGANAFYLFPKENFKIEDFEGVGRDVVVNAGPISVEVGANNTDPNLWGIWEEYGTYHILKVGVGIGAGTHMTPYEKTTFVNFATGINWTDYNYNKITWRR